MANNAAVHPAERRQFPDVYERILERVDRQMHKYLHGDDDDTDDVRSDTLPRVLSEHQQRISDALYSAEQDGLAASKEFEDFNHWVTGVHKQQSGLLADDDETENAESSLKFIHNTNQLKSLESDLLPHLRMLIETQETPMSVRMLQVARQTENELEARKKVLDQVDVNLSDANAKFEALEVENEELTKEAKLVGEHLERYSGTESYDLVSKAKKYKVIEEEWAERKKELEEQIESVKSEVDVYVNREKMLPQLTREMNMQEDVENKLRAKLEDEIRSMGEEIGLSQTNNSAMMTNMKAELMRIRGALTAKESRQTHQTVKRAQIAAERFAQKYRKDRTAMLKDLVKHMKKADDAGKVKLVDEYQEREKQFVSGVFENLLEDLAGILKRYNENLGMGLDQTLAKITSEGEKAVSLLKASKERVSIRISERTIEVSAVNERMISMTGILQDVQEECKDMEIRNGLLTDQLANASSLFDSDCHAVKNEVESLSLFVRKGEFLLERLVCLLRKKMQDRNDLVTAEMVEKSRSKSALCDIKYSQHEVSKCNNDKAKLQVRNAKEFPTKKSEQQVTGNVSSHLVREPMSKAAIEATTLLPQNGICASTGPSREASKEGSVSGASAERTAMKGTTSPNANTLEMNSNEDTSTMTVRSKHEVRKKDREKDTCSKSSSATAELGPPMDGNGELNIGESPGSKLNETECLISSSETVTDSGNSACQKARDHSGECGESFGSKAQMSLKKPVQFVSFVNGAVAGPSPESEHYPRDVTPSNGLMHSDHATPQGSITGNPLDCGETEVLRRSRDHLVIHPPCCDQSQVPQRAAPPVTKRPFDYASWDSGGTLYQSSEMQTPKAKENVLLRIKSLRSYFEEDEPKATYVLKSEPLEFQRTTSRRIRRRTMRCSTPAASHEAKTDGESEESDEVMTLARVESQEVFVRGMTPARKRQSGRHPMGMRIVKPKSQRLTSQKGFLTVLDAEAEHKDDMSRVLTATLPVRRIVDVQSLRSRQTKH